MSKVYQTIKVMDPIRQLLDSGSSLDIMFIIDCTGSMHAWIKTCKEEINSIIDYVRNQYLDIKIRVSVVGYRDYSEIFHISEIFPFSEDI
jgi:hypothetical protein